MPRSQKGKIVSKGRTSRDDPRRVYKSRKPANQPPAKGPRFEHQPVDWKPRNKRALHADSNSQGALRWWGYVWSGLVRDPTSKHRKVMRQAIWLYLYFLVAANWRTGILFRKISTVVSETGFHSRSIQRWIRTLRNNGYITTKSNGRSLRIFVNKWRPISRRATEKTNSKN